MKKLIILLLASVLCSCDSLIDYTSHSFDACNRTSDTLLLRYMKIDMDSVKEVLLLPVDYERCHSTYGYSEDGKQDRMSNQKFLDYFDVFEFVSDGDTFHLDNTNVSAWLQFQDRGVDIGMLEYTYTIVVNDENLK